jgi:hypothetical protein
MNSRWLLILFCVTRLSHAADTAKDVWELTGTEDGVQFYRREVPGSDVVALKGNGTIDAPCWKVSSILLDQKRAPEWVDSMRESRMVRKVGPLAYVEYNYINTPPIIMLDRDFVSLVDIEVNPKEKIFALNYHPGDNTEVPTKGTVRGEIMDSSFRLECLGPEKTRLSAELFADPKGDVAKWIVNFFQKGWPKNTFMALRTQAAKKDIAVPEAFRDVITVVQKFDLSTARGKSE